jgi:hypothetical protein
MGSLAVRTSLPAGEGHLQEEYPPIQAREHYFSRDEFTVQKVGVRFSLCNVIDFGMSEGYG